MKKVFTILAIMCLSVAYSYSQGSKVTMFTQNGEKFWIVVNGEKKNKEPLTKVTVENLTAQNYKFKVVFQDQTIPALDKVIYTKNVETDAYTDATYTIRKNDKGDKFVIRILSGEELATTTTTTTTTAPANTNTATTTTINPQPANNQTTQTYNQTTTTTTGEPQNINIGIGMNVTETPDGVNMNVNMGGVNVSTNVNGNQNGMNTSMNVGGANTSNAVVTSSTTTTTTTTTSSSSSGFNQQPVNNTQNASISKEPTQKPVAYVMPGYSGPTGCAMPMSNESFNTAKNSISSKSFEDSKLTIAKQVVGNNCLTCSQVKDIMKLFNFEDSRLEFAKFAYKHTFDIGNYYQLNDAFTFEASIEELNQFVSNGGN
jgi:hypothetical protein